MASLKSLDAGQKSLGDKFDDFRHENSKDARDLALKTGRLEDRMTRLEGMQNQSSILKTSLIAGIISSVASGLLIVVLLKGFGLK